MSAKVWIPQHTENAPTAFNIPPPGACPGSILRALQGALFLYRITKHFLFKHLFDWQAKVQACHGYSLMANGIQKAQLCMILRENPLLEKLSSADMDLESSD